MRRTRHIVEVRTLVSIHVDKSLETRSKVRARRYERSLRKAGFHPISRAVHTGIAGASAELGRRSRQTAISP